MIQVKKITRIMKILVIARRGATKHPYFGRAPAAPLRSTAGSGVPQLAAARPPHDGGFDKPFATLMAAQPPSLRWLASKLLHALTLQARRRAGAFPRSPTISVFLRFLSE